MKDLRFINPATNGGCYDATAKVKQWEGLSEFDQKEIAEILAKLAVDAYLHPPPSCRICLRNDCPALKDQGECLAERPLRWLPADAPRTRRIRRRPRAKRSAPKLHLHTFLDRFRA